MVGTTIYPSFESLGKLAMIVLIRTFLNYFLHQELEDAQQTQEKKINRCKF